MDSKTEINLFGTTANTLLKEQSFLTSGCSLIDSVLRGGFAKRGITQIYGEAGSGKTQLALQLCLTAQIVENQNQKIAGALYICTDTVFPIKRLQELITKADVAKKYHITSDLIYVEHISCMEDMEKFILEKVPCLLANCKINVIVIDSIAAPFRGEYDDKELKNRAKCLRNIGLQLHKFSRTHNISIICINQVTAAIDDDFLKDINQEKPSLGITWANMVTHSIHMYRNNEKRFARVVQSSYLPRQTIEFKICDTGVVGLKIC